MIMQKNLNRLKAHGFKWLRKKSTDTVSAECIADILATDDGFTVVYTPDAALISTTAVVSRIDWPENLDTHWIFVHWKSMKDVTKPDVATA